MTRDEIARFLNQRQQHWTAHDAEGLASLHAVDGTVQSPMFGQLTGRAAIAESYRKLFAAFPDWTLNPEELIIDGDRVAQPFSAIATHVGDFMGLPGTGRRCQIHGVRLMRITDGLIQDERRLYDFTILLMQVGVLRAKPAY